MPLNKDLTPPVNTSSQGYVPVMTSKHPSVYWIDGQVLGSDDTYSFTVPVVPWQLLKVPKVCRFIYPYANDSEAAAANCGNKSGDCSGGPIVSDPTACKPPPDDYLIQVGCPYGPPQGSGTLAGYTKFGNGGNGITGPIYLIPGGSTPCDAILRVYRNDGVQYYEGPLKGYAPTQSDRDTYHLPGIYGPLCCDTTVVPPSPPTVPPPGCGGVTVNA